MGAEPDFERRLLHARHVQIGTCRLDRSLNEVHDGERCTRLMPKAAAVLEVLVHFSGQPVSKERLMLEVWRGEFPTEDVVTNAISQLRKAFGDGARDSRFIRTVPRVGYALVTSVAPMPEAEPAAPFDAMQAMHDELHKAIAPQVGADGTASRAWLALVVLLLMLALGAGILIGGARWRAKVARPHVIVPLSAQLVPHCVTDRRDSPANRNFVASASELRRDEMSDPPRLSAPARSAQGEGHGQDRNGRVPSRAHLSARGSVAAYGRPADGGAGTAWPLAMAGA